MAGADHTIICFKNGKLMKTLANIDNNDQLISLVPFTYSRDGVILGYEMDTVYDIEPTCFSLINNIRKKKAAKDPSCTRWSHYFDGKKEIFVYQSTDFNITYYFEGNDTYVMLGGYGHYLNPYTHFYHRGYGENFEREMARECYNWLCSDCLDDVLFHIRQTWDYEDELLVLQNMLGYKHWAEFGEEERKKFTAPMEYDNCN